MFKPIPMYKTNAIQLHFLLQLFWYLSQWSGSKIFGLARSAPFFVTVYIVKISTMKRKTTLKSYKGKTPHFFPITKYLNGNTKRQLSYYTYSIFKISCWGVFGPRQTHWFCPWKCWILIKQGHVRFKANQSDVVFVIRSSRVVLVVNYFTDVSFDNFWKTFAVLAVWIFPNHMLPKCNLTLIVNEKMIWIYKSTMYRSNIWSNFLSVPWKLDNPYYHSILTQL